MLAFPVHGDFELGMSAIIGSAIYNILVIPAFSVYARGHPLKANRDLVYREAQFYTRVRDGAHAGPEPLRGL